MPDQNQKQPSSDKPARPAGGASASDETTADKTEGKPDSKGQKSLSGEESESLSTPTSPPKSGKIPDELPSATHSAAEVEKDTADEPEDIFASSKQSSVSPEPGTATPTPSEPSPTPPEETPSQEPVSVESLSAPQAPTPMPGAGEEVSAPEQQPISPSQEPPPKEAEKPTAPERGEPRPDISGLEAPVESTPPEQAAKLSEQALLGSTLETPELDKKEILKEAHDEGAEPKEEKIYVMPEKFKKMKPRLPSKKANKKTILLAGVILLIVIISVAGFYFWTQGYFQKSSEVTVPTEKIVEPTVEIPTPEPVEEPTEKPAEPILSQEQTLKAVLKDETETTIITSAEFYLPEGALEPEAELDLNGSLITEEMKKQELFKQNLYEIIGALYTFTPSDTILNKAGTLKIFYDETLVDEKWEKDVVLGYFKNNLWTPLPSTIDTETNMVSIELEIFPSNTLAIMVDKDKLTPKIEEFQIGKNIPSTTDSDNDGLTDVEEAVFSLEINNPDSDADGNPDGQEIVGLMHPLSADEDKLATSGLINVYTNPTYSYSFFYPGAWLARAIPETDNQEVLIITNTGEFFSITVDNNPERLSVVDWYLRQSPQIDKSLLYETIVNNQPAVWNPDRLTIYIAKENRIYILSYSVGIEKQANFKTVFEMIINSFQFVVQIQGRADGTLIKYPDKPGVYLIESGKKRAFQSGEIFEKIGFKWENVIEIPLSETYTDGGVITGRLDGTLIKYPESPGIYLIEGGKKRAFQSGELFEALGFNWEDVIEIPLDEIYPDGPIIESGITSTPSVE